MIELLWVALGGAAGSVLRYLVTILINKNVEHMFPLGTMTVNVLGCLLIGFLIGLAERYAIFNNELRFLLIVGFCGGFTTFSTFSSETLGLMQDGRYLQLFIYLFGSLLLGLLAVWGAYSLSRHF